MAQHLKAVFEVSKGLSASRVVTTAKVLTEFLNCIEGPHRAPELIEADDHRDLQF